MFRQELADYLVALRAGDGLTPTSVELVAPALMDAMKVTSSTDVVELITEAIYELNPADVAMLTVSYNLRGEFLDRTQRMANFLRMNEFRISSESTFRRRERSATRHLEERLTSFLEVHDVGRQPRTLSLAKVDNVQVGPDEVVIASAVNAIALATTSFTLTLGYFPMPGVLGLLSRHFLEISGRPGKHDSVSISLRDTVLSVSVEILGEETTRFRQRPVRLARQIRLTRSPLPNHVVPRDPSEVSVTTEESYSGRRDPEVYGDHFVLRLTRDVSYTLKFKPSTSD